MRVVITGGAGFIGSHLCDLFLSRGHSVVAVDNFLTGSRENIAHLAKNPRFRFVEQDVIEGLSITGSVNAVLHFASPASPQDYFLHPLETLRVGSAGTENALKLAKAKGARFLLASTSEVYGDPEEHPQRETYWGRVNPIGPRSVYDEAKRYAEAVTMAYRRTFGLETRIVRIFNTYGPRMRLNDGRALPAFFGQALRGQDVTLFGDGRQTRSFCYVSDLVEGVVRLLGSDEGMPVNIGNPVEIPVLTLAREIIALTRSKSRIVHKAALEDDPKQRRPDIRRAKAVLGWSPKVARAAGLKKTLPYFRRMVADEGER
ncbi:MAG: SDR family oxidoreductase [Candidatus Brocadiae bacterium]|nr:SDR family oxidoreductase [Candidatus Brocadiia bacterium]